MILGFHLFHNDLRNSQTVALNMSLNYAKNVKKLIPKAMQKIVQKNLTVWSRQWKYFGWITSDKIFQ